MQLSPDQIELHDRLFSEASNLVKGELIVEGRIQIPPDWLSRKRLSNAKKLFEMALTIHTVNWCSMYMIGKIEQRLGNRQVALEWMLKAREFAPDNTTLAKDASLMASHSGMHELAARIADEAILLAPHDAGLFVNAGLAHIYNGQYDLALSRFREAARIEPEAETNQKLAAFAAKVASGTFPPPKVDADIVRGIEKIEQGLRG
jgi:tetratricopeptide (TPR) repeat protein